MKITRYLENGLSRLCIVDDQAGRILPLSPPGGDDIRGVIAGGAKLLAELQKRASSPDAGWIPLPKLMAPLHPHRNIFCVGKNYRAHAKEFQNSGFDATGGEAIPEAPIIFTKAPSSVIASGEPVPAYLDDTNSTDYEGELAIIIGKGGRAISREVASDHVFGYTIVNDITARTLQHFHRQWFLGKSIDGFCPLGPWIVTKDEIPNLGEIELRTFVDGELRQQAKIADLIFDVPFLIETISKRITLEPGDVIATGTPEGVGIGFKPPKFLQAGNRVRVEVDRIGAIENMIAGSGTPYHVSPSSDPH